MEQESDQPTGEEPAQEDSGWSMEDVAALKHEAASRRRALRAVEAERDQLRQRLDATHRVAVEAEAAQRFLDPRDVWALTSIDAFRGADGLIDPQLVRTEFDRIEQDRPHWRKPASEPEPEPESRELPEVHQGPRGTPERRPPSFGAQLKDSLRGGG